MSRQTEKRHGSVFPRKRIWTFVVVMSAASCFILLLMSGNRHPSVGIIHESETGDGSGEKLFLSPLEHSELEVSKTEEGQATSDILTKDYLHRSALEGAEARIFKGAVARSYLSEFSGETEDFSQESRRVERYSRRAALSESENLLEELVKTSALAELYSDSKVLIETARDALTAKLSSDSDGDVYMRSTLASGKLKDKDSADSEAIKVGLDYSMSRGAYGKVAVGEAAELSYYPRDQEARINYQLTF